MYMRKKKRHLTPREIMEQCKSVARECRMANRTPWTAMGIMCAYTIMKREGFKGQRILKITQKIDEFAEEIRDWQIDIQDNEYDADKFDFVFERIFEIAKQMKGRC